MRAIAQINRLEYRLRLIPVVMDRTVSVNFLMIAVRAVIIAVKMISIVLMLFVKNYFHKTQENPLIHFIISFGDEVRKYEKAKAYAVLIGAVFKCRYQLIWAVHQKKRGDSLFHIHIIMNSVSFVDGKLYDSSKENLSKFCDEVERITGTGCRYYFAGYCSTDDV